MKILFEQQISLTNHGLSFKYLSIRILKQINTKAVMLALLVYYDDILILY